MEAWEKIEEHFKKSEWVKARQLILRELKKTPEDHWLLTRLGVTYYEEHKYEKALEISKRAVKIAPNCPLVLWDHAGNLDMVGQHKEAIKIWKGLLKRGVDSIAYDECGEGIRWARSLLNDCRYRIAVSYKSLGNLSEAKRFMREHITNRSSGISSIYLLSMVKKELRNLICESEEKKEC